MDLSAESVKIGLLPSVYTSLAPSRVMHDLIVSEPTKEQRAAGAVARWLYGVTDADPPSPDSTWVAWALDQFPPRRYLAAARAGDTETPRRVAAGPLMLRAVAFALCIYLVGLVIASIGGTASIMLYASPARTPLVYFTLVGIAWVAFWGGWADERLWSLRGELQPAFSDKCFEPVYRTGLGRIYSRKRHLAWSAFFIALSWLYVGLRVFVWRGFTILPKRWWGEPRLVHALVLWWLLIPAVALIVTMMIGARDYSQLVRRIADLALTLPPALARAALKPIVLWGILTGFGWTGGVTLLIFVFRFVPIGGQGTPTGAGRVAPLAVMTFIGLWGACFLVIEPQYRLHEALSKTKDRMLYASAHGLRAAGGEAAGPEEHVKLVLSKEDYAAADRVAREAASAPEWVFSPPGELLLFASQIVLPLAGLIVSLAIRK